MGLLIKILQFSYQLANQVLEATHPHHIISALYFQKHLNTINIHGGWNDELSARLQFK